MMKSKVPLVPPFSHRRSNTLLRVASGLAAGLTWLAAPLDVSVAQEDESGEAESGPAHVATTAAEPDIPVTDLRIMLRPLSRAQVEAELDAWIEVLQAKAMEIRDAELASFRATETAVGELAETEDGADAARKDDLADLAETAVALRAQRAALVERVTTVIAAVRAKGGDPAEAELYVKEVSALPPTPAGFKAFASMARAWLTAREGGVKFAKNVGLFVLCVVGAWLLGAILSRVLDRALRRFGRSSELLRSFFTKAIRRVLLVVGIVVGISYLGVNITPLIAAIGAAGLVVGLALQGTLGNFASGLMILAYRPFDVGDVVGAGGVTGTVDSMTLVSTVLKTPDNQLVIVPNSRIWEDVITNVTASRIRRVDLTFGIGYQDDVDKARSILESILVSHPKILSDPAPVVKVNELGPSSVDLVVRPWTMTSDYWDVYWDLHESVKKRFDAEGISIPYPQQDIHIHQVGAAPDPSGSGGR